MKNKENNRFNRFIRGFIIISSLLLAGADMPMFSQQVTSPPIIPVGLDAYRSWEQWPVQRIGARAYMRSTYDRSGGNESADASHFLYMGDEDHNYTLDIAGKGYLYFVRTNHWHGSPWHYIVDGNSYLIKETATDHPVKATERFDKTTFLPEASFPEPLAYTWSTTKGADLMWVPIGFEKSFQLAYSRTRYGTGYYIYHQYANEEYLSHPIRAWQMNQVPDPEVVRLLDKAGTDIAPKNCKKKTGTLKLGKEKLEFAHLRSRSSVRAIKFTLPLEKAIDLERIRLQITWDGRSEPSVDAPLCLFFGAGTFYNREQKEYLVKAFPVNIRFDYARKKVELACYYPMPFFRSAKFELAGITPSDTKIEYELRYEPYTLAPNQSSYFHATYKDFPVPEAGKDLVLLDTKGIEGAAGWSGNFVGTTFIFTHNGVLGTLEGDPRFFFDDSRTPQAQGTGSEEWGGGGDYWGGRNMTLPFAGHPCGIPDRKKATDEKDLIHSAYRFLLADLMPFGNRAVICLEHGAENLSYEHYETVTYWYGLPAPSLVLTDELNIGDEADERKHAYTSPQASRVETILSRYELGIDRFPTRIWGGVDTTKVKGFQAGKEIYPAHLEKGRHTQGSSEFTVKLRPDNYGVLLRRTLDYSFPNQKAEIYVADDRGGEWNYAGIWYLAGSNTCIYSDPRGELDKRFYRVQTSNRRFRDDEFLLPARLTQGKERIKVRVKFVPVERELYPGMPFPKENAWSELRYKVYSYILPELQ
ncbi:DUF2961 domain-containing protein [Parabacteroides pacaensis]|uniref:DUF2961 domain-containing protein n=1 Tax=Parabacteroides pacaensis TaxID=2086575 RepID=UPI000D0EFE13|nr:DUF2961 domain-containing protein [Parabacteroides pacaensis]